MSAPIASYRDTFQLLFTFAQARLRKPPSTLALAEPKNSPQPIRSFSAADRRRARPVSTISRRLIWRVSLRPSMPTISYMPDNSPRRPTPNYTEWIPSIPILAMFHPALLCRAPASLGIPGASTPSRQEFVEPLEGTLGNSGQHVGQPSLRKYIARFLAAIDAVHMAAARYPPRSEGGADSRNSAG